MKRTTITIPDELEAELDAYLAEQEPQPSLTGVIQTALRVYLEERKWKERGYRAPQSRLQIPVAEKGSGRKDISEKHDKYLTS